MSSWVKLFTYMGVVGVGLVLYFVKVMGSFKGEHGKSQLQMEVPVGKKVKDNEI